jgi:outer membrane immunogenic protein
MGKLEAIVRRLPIVAVCLVSLAARSGLAADLQMRAPARMLVPGVVYGWVGCYVGIEGGADWGQSRHDTAFGATSDAFAVTGGVAGGTVGCNYQTSQWMLGLEGDLSWTSMRGSAVEAAAFPATFSSETRENWLATVRGRLGWAWQRWLIYVTGGYAAAAVEARVSNPTLALDVSDTKTRNGFTLGAGIEAAIAGNWTAKLEYLYVGLQNASYFDVPPLAINARTGVPISNNIYRVGLNYRFAWPIVSR